MTYAAENQSADRVAIITGGSRGIGRATALALAAQGVAVVLTGRNSADLAAACEQVRALGGRAQAVVADVTSYPDCQRMVEVALAEFGRLDVLICNAGRAPDFGDLAQIDPVEWRATIDANLNGVFYSVRAALPQLIEQRSGRILLIGSGSGHQPMTGFAAYAVSKAGASHLTSVLAEELNDYGIDVNEVIPGPVETGMTQRGQRPPTAAASAKPRPRRKTPEEVAEFISWVVNQPPFGPTGQVFSMARRHL